MEDVERIVILYETASAAKHIAGGQSSLVDEILSNRPMSRDTLSLNLLTLWAPLQGSWTRGWQEKVHDPPVRAPVNKLVKSKLRL